MRSGTSFFDWTVFKKTVFRFWPLWTVYFVGWLFALPLNGLTQLRLDANATFEIDYGYLENFAQYTVPESVTRDVMIVFLIFGALAAMAVFSHLFNARSANLFGSLPVRREGLFLTHYLAGLAFFLVPNLVIFLLTLLVEAAGGCVVMKGLLFWLAVACGEGFFFYTLAVFCAMFTGHILALPAFYGIVNGLVLGITGLVTMVLQLFYYGFDGVPDSAYEAALWFTPVGKLYQAVECYRMALPEDVTNSILSDDKWMQVVEGLDAVGIYAIVAVALAAAAFFLYRARRLESAGDVVAVRWMKPVFKYGVALCAGLALGMGTMVILYGGEIGLMIAIVVWGVIGYFAAEMLLQKSFKVFKAWKGAVAVTAVFLVLFCVVGFDLTGYETRVPDPAVVESVRVRGYSASVLRDDGDDIDEVITDPKLIELVTVLHRAAVEQRDWTEADYAGARTENGSTVGASLTLTYSLKGGGSLTRYYWLNLVPKEVDQEGTGAWAMQRLCDDRELYWKVYGFDELEDWLARGGRLDRAETMLYNGYSGWTDNIYYGNDAVALLAAVKEDFFAGRVGARRVGEEDWSQPYPERSVDFISDSRDNGAYYYIRIALQDTATSTLAALEEMADRAVPGAVQPWPYDGEYSGEIIVEPATEFIG